MSLYVAELHVMAVLCGYSVAKLCIHRSQKQPHAAPAWGLQIGPVCGLWYSLLPPSGSTEKGRVRSLSGGSQRGTRTSGISSKFLVVPEILGIKGAVSVLTSPPSWFRCTLRFEKHWFRLSDLHPEMHEMDNQRFFQLRIANSPFLWSSIIPFLRT